MSTDNHSTAQKSSPRRQAAPVNTKAHWAYTTPEPVNETPAGATIAIALPGITCIQCVKKLKVDLENNAAALNLGFYSIDISDKILYVRFTKTHRQSLPELTKIIDDCGIDWKMAEIRNHSPKQTKNTGFFQQLKKAARSHWLMAAVGLISGIALLALSLSGVALPLAVVIGLTASATALNLIIGAPSFYHAWKKWRHQRTLTMDSLFALSGLVIVGVSIAGLFIPGLPMMLEAGLLIFGFRHLGQGIEEQLVHRSAGDVHFQDRLPEQSRKIVNNYLITINTAELSAGDIIEIAPGEVVPCDAILIDEQAEVIDTLVSGSNVPKTIGKNTSLLSGMVLAGEKSKRMRITATASESYLAKMDEQLITAQDGKAPVQQWTDRLLNYFIPAILLISLLSGIGLALTFPLAVAIKCAAAVLVSACPCTLGLIVPLVMKAAMAKSLKHGVFFKDPGVLQTAAGIDTIVFDLNGSLTRGEPSVTAFYQFDAGISAQVCKAVAAQMEQGYSHPIAKALRKYCRTNLTADRPPMPMPNLQTVAGGLAAPKQDDDPAGHSYYLGNARCMADQGIQIPRLSETTSLPGEQRLYLACDQKVVAMFVIRDTLREQAVSTVNRLREEGYAIYICTGADADTANSYARMLGVTASANCVPVKRRPEDKTKSDFIAWLQEKKGHRVAMVGDGGNDGPALVKSDLGIFMPSNASDPVTRDKANVVITGQDLLPLLHCFTIARQTMRNIKQNLFFSLLYNATTLLLTGGLLVALGFSINPALGAGLMVLQTALILLNVYRFATRKVKYRSFAAEEKHSFGHGLHRLGAAEHLQNDVKPATEQTPSPSADQKNPTPHQSVLPTPPAIPEPGIQPGSPH